MAEQPCELCADPTPTRLLCRDPARGWEDGLCPACWMLNQPADAAPGVEAHPGTQWDALIQQALTAMGALTPEQCLQRQMLTQYALQWQAQQQAALGAGLAGTSQPGQASGFCGLGGLFGGLGICDT